MARGSDLVVAFWKPYGVLTAFTDRDRRATIADYVDLPDVYPAGRLDRDSEGLVLLPRSPRLRGQLTSSGHPRRYLVQVEGDPTEESITPLRNGVDLKDGRAAPAEVRILPTAPSLPARSKPIRVRKSVPDAWLELDITEGRNRQVRRMTAAVGHPTLRLVRTAIGPIGLDGLSEGAWRRLSVDEVALLADALVKSDRKGPGASRPARGRPRRGPRSPG